MNIVHICLESNAIYTDNWGYQDNLIPKFHKKLGHNVTVISTNYSYDKSGNPIDVGVGDYILQNGVRVIRLKCNFLKKNLGRKIGSYDIYNLLIELKPCFIMVHGLNSICQLQVVRYIKREGINCKIVADTHRDSFNSNLIPIQESNLLIRLLRISFWKIVNNVIFRTINLYTQNYYNKIYGITPDCIITAIKDYGIKKSKLKLLRLGCDMSSVNYENKDIVKKNIRAAYEIHEDNFLIVSGGKLDKLKNIHNLIKAVNKINNKNIKLIIFGEATSKEYYDYLNKCLGNNYSTIKLVGFLELSQIYDLFLSADLAVFPGSQSLLWINAICCGLPLIVKKHSNIEYLDLGGNVIFLDRTDEFNLIDTINDFYSDRKRLKHMSNVSYTKGSKIFSYEEIAKKVLYN